MWTTLLWIAGILWILLSINFLKPEEMAVYVLFGKPLWFCDSGIHFVPYLPFCYLEKRPKTLFNLDYFERKVITKEGTHEGVHYGAQVIEVDSVAYVRFPRDENLVTIVQANIPLTEEGLKTWTEDSIVGALRVVLGNRTWKEISEKLEIISREAEEIFTKADGALLMAGFVPEDLRLTIKEVTLPRELVVELIAPDRERLRGEAAKFVARRQATEWVQMVLQAMAESRGISLEKVQKEVQDNPELQNRFMEYAEEMNMRMEEADRGALFDFRTPDAKESGSVLSLIALWQKLSRTGGQEGKTVQGKDKGGKEPISRTTEQETEEAAGE